MYLTILSNLLVFQVELEEPNEKKVQYDVLPIGSPGGGGLSYETDGDARRLA